MSNPIQHADFGEKIGGARKDLWQQRGLLSEDLVYMNSREADSYIKKDNIWKKPDYDALIASGIPYDVAYYCKTVRDSLNAVPRYYRYDDTPEKRLERQKEYIDTIREVQAVMEMVKTQEDAMGAYDKFFVDGGYAALQTGSISGNRYTVTEKGNANTTITNKLFKAMYIGSDSRYKNSVITPARLAQFHVPKEQRVPHGYGVHYNDGKGSYSAKGDWRSGTYYVTKGRRILKLNLESHEKALEWIREDMQQQTTSGKKKFIPPQLESIRRNGPDYRGGRHMEGQDYLDTFGFRGGEFGNWMSQNDRQASLDMGFEALKDLAWALKISDKDISYGGELSIAFGARGSGNAVAHYEPMRQVINLTKMRGAGSLAHEWWHGLDDFLGRKYDAKGLLSEKPYKHPLFKKLIDTINQKPATPEQMQKMTKQSEARQLQIAESLLNQYVFPYIKKSGNEQALAEYEAAKSAFLQGDEGSVERLTALKKSVYGRVIPKEDKQYLMVQEHFIRSGKEKNPEPASYTVPTEYYKNSKMMGKISQKDGGYWDSNTEMTARAFATYIMDKLPGHSDYLVGHAECAVSFHTNAAGETDIIRAYPQGEERAAINAVFDEIVAELKKENILTHEDKAQFDRFPAAQPPKDFDSPDEVPEAALPNMGCEQMSISEIFKKTSIKDRLRACSQSKAAIRPAAAQKRNDTIRTERGN